MSFFSDSDSDSKYDACGEWIYPISRINLRKVRRRLVEDLMCSQYGTTDPKDPRWELGIALTTPIYHIAYDQEWDMGYDYDGNRCPYVAGYSMYVWTTDTSGNAIVIYNQGTTPLDTFEYCAPEFYNICEGVRLYRKNLLASPQI